MPRRKDGEGGPDIDAIIHVKPEQIVDLPQEIEQDENKNELGAELLGRILEQIEKEGGSSKLGELGTILTEVVKKKGQEEWWQTLIKLLAEKAVEKGIKSIQPEKTGEIILRGVSSDDPASELTLTRFLKEHYARRRTSQNVTDYMS